MVDGVNQLQSSQSPDDQSPPHQEQSSPQVVPAPKAGWGIGRGLLVGAVFFVTASVFAGLGAWLTLVAPLPPRWLPEGNASLTLGTLLKRSVNYDITRPVNILVMGIDEVPGTHSTSLEALAGRTDTMLLTQVNPTSASLNVLSIPRDTQISLSNYGTIKINQANVLGGPSFAARVVSQTLNDVPIDRYVRVNTDAFRELVDLVGGVEVFVPEPMYYVDRSQDLYIDLPQGWQTLNGDQAEQFARFRNDAYGDIGRVQRQQQLLAALRDRLVSPTIVPKLPEIIQLAQRYVDTNLSLEEMLAIADYALDLERDDLHMVMLPGRFSLPEEYNASYWIMDPEGADQVMREYFNDGSIPQTADADPTPVTQLRIAVQNSTTEPNVASDMVQYLRDQGFRNVYITQDWPDPHDTTEVIVQRGDRDSARSVQSILGIGKLVSASTGSIESDLTIRVGQDWVDQQLAPQSDAPAD